MPDTSTSCTPIIELNNVKKSYPLANSTIEILKGVQFSLKKGEFVSITGPSGAGKSTLLNILGCMDKPSSGTYHLNGKDISSLDDEHLSFIRSKSIGFVFQTFNLIPQLTIFENVEIPFLYQGAINRDNRKKIIHCIEQVGLLDRMYHTPSQLSGGEIQRAAIARALAIDPALILADEPTGNLDSKTGNSIITLFQKLNENGVTIIIVTHNEQVAHASKRWISLQDGKIEKDRILNE